MEKTSIFEPLYVYNHGSINAYFSKNSNDFVVREVPLYEVTGSGEHAMIEIQKKDLTTFEALHILSECLGIKMRDFGYAGLKDKEGMTTQYITFPFKYSDKLENFSHEKMKILSLAKHNNKLRTGHLKGNNFFIRLKKVFPVDAKKLGDIISSIRDNGFANYFGYQRFGKYQDNAEQGRKLLTGEEKIKNPKLKNFLISAYQSDLFNKWLSKRIEISKFAKEFSVSEFAKIYNLSQDESKKIVSQKQFYKILEGEVLGHYPFGKFFLCEDLESEIKRFCERDITSCGLLIGGKAYESVGLAKRFEDEIYSESYQFMNLMNGSRRFGWSYIDNVSFKYDELNKWFGINFFLPKGSYATVVLKEILHKDIFE